MRSPANVPLHLRLVLANGLVLALGVLAMSLAPADRTGLAALVVLAVGLALVVLVNTRHFRRSLKPLMAMVGTLRNRWEGERRAQTARSLVTKEYDGQQMAAQLEECVGTNLSAALVGLKRVIDQAPPELAADLQEVQRRARTSLVEVRRIGRRLRPELLEDLGLHSALSMLLNDFTARHPGIKVRRTLEGPFRDLPGRSELAVFRVVEEALSNVARHARASRVEVSLSREDGVVVLRVRDDGVGLGQSRERTGILGMRERAALAGGRLTVTPDDRGGTEVRLEVPA